MRTTIDRAGRVVIPKELRDKVGLKPDMEIEIRYDNGIIEISPPPSKGKLIRKGSILVWSPDDRSAVLTNEMVNDLIEEIRDERMRDALEGGH